MKKIIVLFLLLAGSAQAGQFLETFAEVRAQVRAKLNINSTSSFLTDSTANQYIREGMLVVNPMVMFDKEVKTTVLTFKQNTYSLDTMLIGIISAEISRSDSVKTLKYVPRGEWYNQYVAPATAGKIGYEKWPSFFDYSDDQIFIYPTPTNPNLTDTLKIYGWQKVGSIDTVSTMTKMPEAYRVAVLDYVIYVAAKARSHPNTMLYYQDFQRDIAAINAAFNRKEAVSAPASR